MAARLCGVALAPEPNRACYIPLGHRPGDGLDFTGVGEIAQLPIEHAMPRLKALLEDDSVLKIGQNIKYDYVVMRRYGVRLAPHDTMLMAYACDQGRGGLAGFGMDELSKRHLGHTPIAFKEVAGKGKAQTTVRLRARGQGDGICSRGCRAVTLSTDTQSNVVCALPLPATSLKAMACARWRFDSSSMPKSREPPRPWSQP